jgi:hypothetical protein
MAQTLALWLANPDKFDLIRPHRQLLPQRLETFDNIASTGSDLTTFYCDLFAAIGSAFQLVNETSLGEMLKFQPLSNTHMVPRCVDLSLPRRGSRPMLRRVV